MIKPFAQTGEASIENLARHFDSTRWYPWRFNEIVGWISLTLRGASLYGEGWLIRERFSGLVRRKTFYFVGKMCEYDRYLASDAAVRADEIYPDFKDSITRQVCTGQHKNCLIDFSGFDFTAELIDWRRVLHIDLVS